MKHKGYCPANKAFISVYQCNSCGVGGGVNNMGECDQCTGFIFLCSKCIAKG